MDDLVARLRSAKKPAIFYCNALGDHLLTRPTVLALQQVYAGKLSYIGAGKMPDIFYSDVAFATVKRLFFTKTDEHDHSFSVSEAVEACAEFDAIISLNPWHSSQVDELVSNAHTPLFVGLAPALNRSLPISQAGHMTDVTFQMATILAPSLRVESFVSLPPIPIVDRNRYAQLRQALPLSKRILAIHTWTKPFKRWPQARFRDLIELFLGRHADFVVVVVDPTDSDLDQNKHSDRTFILDGIDMLTATEVVANCEAFLGIDSYFLHVADFANRPAVGIFGPTSPEQWGFRVAGRTRHVALEDIGSITPSEVLAALDEVIAS